MVLYSHNLTKEGNIIPRHKRTLSKTKIYHVMMRGNERKDIFLDEEDKANFLKILSKLTGFSLSETNTLQFFIHAYCLMNNHVHLIVNEGEDEISRIMKRIGVSYAYYFNKKYSRLGHLFQDRFKSEAIEDEKYLLAAARYIHNNPVKAGIVEKASVFPWSSYNAYAKGESFKSFIGYRLGPGYNMRGKRKSYRTF